VVFLVVFSAYDGGNGDEMQKISIDELLRPGQCFSRMRKVPHLDKFDVKEIEWKKNDEGRLRGSHLFVADSGHDALHDGLDFVSRQGERVRIGNDLNCLFRTVDDDLANLTLTKVLLEPRSQSGVSRVLEILPELCQKISAAKHLNSPFHE